MTFVDLLTIMAPVLALLGLGLSLRPMLTPETRRHLSQLIFYVLLPALLVGKLSQQSPALQSVALAAAVGCGLIIVVSLLALRGWRALAPADRAGLIPCTVRFNGAFVGLPVTMMLVAGSPSSGQEIASYLLLMAALIPITHLAAIICIVVPLQAERSPDSRLALLRSVTWQVAKNPVILATIVGLLCGWLAPGQLNASPLGEAVSLLGQGAIPLALLLAGASVDLRRIRQAGWPVIQVTAIKLFLMPGLALALGLLIGLQVDNLRNLVVIMGCPVAAAAAAMAQSMGAAVNMTATTIAITTLLAPFSLMLWLLILKTSLT